MTTTYKEFYHYTNGESLKAIWGQNSDRPENLIPRRCFICLGDAFNLESKAYDDVIWGMLSPRPAEYTENRWHKGSTFFEDCLGRARDHLKPTFMLKASLLPEDDVYVADWSVHFREDFKGTEMKNRKIVHEVKKAYWESLVPLADYKEGQYRLPEVICFSEIPKERLSIELVIPGSEMQSYIDQGVFDKAALERDKEKRRQIENNMKDFF